MKHVKLKKWLIETCALGVILLGITAALSHAEGPVYMSKIDKSKLKIRDLVRDTWIFTAPKIRFNQEIALAVSGKYFQKKLNSNCKLDYGTGFIKGPKIEKNKVYRITEVISHHQALRLELANLYNPIFSLVIDCAKISQDDSIEKLEAALEHVVTIEAKN